MEACGKRSFWPGPERKVLSGGTNTVSRSESSWALHEAKIVVRFRCAVVCLGLRTPELRKKVVFVVAVDLSRNGLRSGHSREAPGKTRCGKRSFFPGVFWSVMSFFRKPHKARNLSRSLPRTKKVVSEADGENDFFPHRISYGS